MAVREVDGEGVSLTQVMLIPVSSHESWTRFHPCVNPPIPVCEMLSPIFAMFGYRYVNLLLLLMQSSMSSFISQLMASPGVFRIVYDVFLQACQ